MMPIVLIFVWAALVISLCSAVLLLLMFLAAEDKERPAQDEPQWRDYAEREM